MNTQCLRDVLSSGMLDAFCSLRKRFFQFRYPVIFDICVNVTVVLHTILVELIFRRFQRPWIRNPTLLPCLGAIVFTIDVEVSCHFSRNCLCVYHNNLRQLIRCYLRRPMFSILTVPRLSFILCILIRWKISLSNSAIMYKMIWHIGRTINLLSSTFCPARFRAACTITANVSKSGQRKKGEGIKTKV
jgi:hypothetical protein